MTLIGFGGGTGAAILILALIVRSALEKAIVQAGREEIARLQASLALEADAKRNGFLKLLEDSKILAAKNLEEFKSVLQLESEVRRQVAAKKVDQLIAMGTSGESLLRELSTLQPGSQAELGRARELLMQHIEQLKHGTFLLSRDLGAACSIHAESLRELRASVESVGLEPTLEAVRRVVPPFLDKVRKELTILD